MSSTILTLAAITHEMAPVLQHYTNAEVYVGVLER